jgi:alpha/beta superfamily hydrolase
MPQIYLHHYNHHIIEIAIDYPMSDHVPPCGLAVLGHPHPLFGGTMDNKVVQTMNRTLQELGYVVVRFNFRGVGQSTGLHDDGMGEIDDAVEVVRYAQQLDHGRYADLPLVLGGFSFGSFIMSHVQQRLIAQGQTIARMMMLGTAAGKWSVAPVPSDSIVIHGENDDTIPLADVMNWARAIDVPVIVIPNADHFFHKKLVLLKQLILQNWGNTPRI